MIITYFVRPTESYLIYNYMKKRKIKNKLFCNWVAVTTKCLVILLDKCLTEPQFIFCQSNNSLYIKRMTFQREI